ncbi:type 2 periplasmic-binding domain-containing protein [endosymbiont of unidentified scaly snail isolate Monju]|uniref:hypothetical protein n=1 Tax=endosymbiont of unidentified scaly snail isolate Monju TaxID=1248727 RepID=UPI0003891E80|nr:hypothetical protein [endosymbiont of unidentified scaly snail isolate Monju]BAN69841.1 conserved hypothetical protein [endosymbiont of unidentified scaly snail isolate Monju]
MTRGVEFSDAPRSMQPADPVTVRRPAGSDLAISLDQQLYDLLAPAIRDYARQHHLKIRMQRGNCGQSAAGLRRHLVDIGGFCCPPGDKDRLPGLRFHTLGIGALAIVTHPDANIESLSQQQVRDIFSGKTRQLAAARGRPPIPLHLVTRLHCRSRPGHWHLILPEEENFFPLANQTGGINEMLSAVEGYIGAIGYETLYWISRHAPDLKVLHIDGMDPAAPHNLLHGNYPYYRVFNITSWSHQDGSEDQVSLLIEWLKSYFEQVAGLADMIPAGKLREAGWKFRNDELVGGPE